jgi:hypothetical protein
VTLKCVAHTSAIDVVKVQNTNVHCMALSVLKRGVVCGKGQDLIDSFVVMDLESLIEELFEETRRFLVRKSVEIPFHLDVCCLVQEDACWSLVVVDNCHLIKVVASCHVRASEQSVLVCSSNVLQF